MKINNLMGSGKRHIALSISLDVDDIAIKIAKELDRGLYLDNHFQVYISLNESKSKINYMMIQYPTAEPRWENIRLLAETEYDMVEDYLRKEKLFGE